MMLLEAESIYFSSIYFKGFVGIAQNFAFVFNSWTEDVST